MPDDLTARRPPPVQINVTAEDIAHGTRQGCQNCPVALAIWRAAPGAMELVVMPDDVKFYRGGGGRNPVRRLPKSARRFIRDFDAGRPAAPFVFPMNVPEDLR